MLLAKVRASARPVRVLITDLTATCNALRSGLRARPSGDCATTRIPCHSSRERVTALSRACGGGGSGGCLPSLRGRRGGGWPPPVGGGDEGAAWGAGHPLAS